MVRITYTADAGHFRAPGVGFAPGDTRDVDDDLATHLLERDDFERADAEPDDAEPDDSTPAPQEDASTFDPSEMTVDELEAYLADTPLGEDELGGAIAAEEAGKNRDTAKAALRDALED